MLGATRQRVVADGDDVAEHVAQVAGDGDLFHRMLDPAFFHPETCCTARIVAGDVINTVAQQFGHEQPLVHVLDQAVEIALAGLIKQMDRGLLVTELLGHGVNYVTGDYSRGAAGFWVEKGRIKHAVEEITIAGNLRDMFRSIVAVGNDALPRGAKLCGSVLIERMKIAGR